MQTITKKSLGNCVLVHAKTWVNLQNNILNESSQTEEATHFMFHLNEKSNPYRDTK